MSVDVARFTLMEHAGSILIVSPVPRTGPWPDVNLPFTHDVGGGGRDEEIE